MVTRVVVRSWQPHAGQLKILRSTARFRVVAAGRRFGKTTLALHWLTTDVGGALWGVPVAYFAPTYKLAAEAWGELERILRPAAVRINRRDMRIELVGGGSVECWSMEDKSAGRGRRYARVVIDEAAHARNLREVWEQAIRATLTDFAGCALIVSTPRGYNYFYDLFEMAKRYEDWEAFRAPTRENPTISAEEIEFVRKQLPSLVYLQEYEAEFVSTTGTLVSRSLLQFGEPPSDAVLCAGVDLAISRKTYSDYTAIVLVARAQDADYVVAAHRGHWGFRETVAALQEYAREAAIVAVEAVQYQAALVEELLHETRLPVVPVRPHTDKIARFLPLLGRIEQGKLRFSPNLPQWYLDELLSFPEGQHDDAVDATIYAVFAPYAAQPEELVLSYRR